MSKDRSFDNIAAKFGKNIYGTSKGVVRERVLQRDLLSLTALQQSKPLRILDVGGGQGQLALFLAGLGHQVTLVDISSEMLQMAQQQAQLRGLSGQLRFIHAPLQQLPALQLGQFDLVLCHAVLEWLVDQQAAIQILFDLVVAQGHLSLMFYNKAAKRFGNILFGNFEYVKNDLQVKKKVSLNPNQPLEPEEVFKWLAELPLELRSKTGVRCFHDYLRNREQWKTHLEELIALELQFNQQEPYASLGRYMHLLLYKKNQQ